MNPGLWLAMASVAVSLLAAFVLRTRLPAMVVALLLTVAGAGIGWGGMLLRPDPSPGEFVAAIVLLAVLVPAHVRIVLGRFGPGASGEPPPAASPDEEAPSPPVR